jgi:hypothetical protein
LAGNPQPTKAQVKAATISPVTKGGTTPLFNAYLGLATSSNVSVAAPGGGYAGCSPFCRQDLTGFVYDPSGLDSLGHELPFLCQGEIDVRACHATYYEISDSIDPNGALYLLGGIAAVGACALGACPAIAAGITGLASDVVAFGSLVRATSSVAGACGASGICGRLESVLQGLVEGFGGAPRAPRVGPGTGIGPGAQSLGEGRDYATHLVGAKYGPGTVVMNPGLRIAGLRGSAVDPYHAIDRIIERGVTPSMLVNTVRTPRVVLQQGSRYVYLSESAAVVLRADGQVVTTWTSREFLPVYWQILKDAG